VAKEKSVYICSQCNHKIYKWVGKCSECESWNTFEPYYENNKRNSTQPKENKARPIHLISREEKTYLETGISEFDRVIGGGLCKGSFTLIGGSPGVGKSTLLLTICASFLMEHPRSKILYVSGEESCNQIIQRCNRLGITSDRLLILNETNWQDIQDEVKNIDPALFILDSIQTTMSSDIQSMAGTVSQIKEVTFEIMNMAKAKSIISIVIGHITKEGELAGPKVLEHMVDTVLTFEGEGEEQYRYLRSRKNRFGGTEELGVFEMTMSGLKGVHDTYLLNTKLDKNEVVGKSLTCSLFGKRLMFSEIQSLVFIESSHNPKRIVEGIDFNRINLLATILDKNLGLNLTKSDLYLNVVGDLKIQSRECDLAIIASLISSIRGEPIVGNTVFLGEVNLTGEIRKVSNLEKKLKEITNIQFERVITAINDESLLTDYSELKIISVNNINDLENHIFG
jgi:DNA repair protein RadA/Sms